MTFCGLLILLCRLCCKNCEGYLAYLARLTCQLVLGLDIADDALLRFVVYFTWLWVQVLHGFYYLHSNLQHVMYWSATMAWHKMLLIPLDKLSNCALKNTLKIHQKR